MAIGPDRVACNRTGALSPLPELIARGAALVFLKPERLPASPRASAHVQVREQKIMSESVVVVGIDVASDLLDVAVITAQLSRQRYANDPAGHRLLAEALAPLDV